MTAAGPGRGGTPLPESGSAIGDLARKLGYEFKDLKHLDQALTHSSVAASRNLSNERLEFLGDRVLGLIIADLLLVEFTDEDEGAIGYRFAALVRREALAEVAATIGLYPHIRHEQDASVVNPRQKSSLLANTMEAVIAAIYLDGGFSAAQSFVEAHWRERLGYDAQPPKDSKTRLQEYVQGKGLALPTYTIVERSGPDHEPVFTIEVSVADQPPARGRGRSKRLAETEAAEKLLAELEGKR